MKLSKLYGKKIESFDKKICGTIIGVSVLDDEIAGFLCAAVDDTEFFADARGCKLKREVAQFLRLCKEGAECVRLRLGLPAYTVGGKLVGAVTDYGYAGAKICEIWVGAARYPYNLAAIGDAVILQSEKARTDEYAKDMLISAIISPQRV